MSQVDVGPGGLWTWFRGILLGWLAMSQSRFGMSHTSRYGFQA